MTRPLSLTLAIALLHVAVSASYRLEPSLQIPRDIPKEATVEVVLLGAPRINDQGSHWEITYEFRIANDATVFNERKKLEEKSGERVGELIKEGATQKPLRPAENQRVVFQIPFSPEVQERLRNHPRDRLKVTPGKMTAEDIKLSKELEMRSQSFLFYTIIDVYDARMKKHLIIPTLRVWPFGAHADARFEIRIEINADGSYSTNSSTRKDALKITR